MPKTRNVTTEDLEFVGKFFVGSTPRDTRVRMNVKPTTPCATREEHDADLARLIVHLEGLRAESPKDHPIHLIEFVPVPFDEMPK